MAMGLLGGLTGMANMCFVCNSHSCTHMQQMMAAQQQQGMQHYHDALRHYGAIGAGGGGGGSSGSLNIEVASHGSVSIATNKSIATGIATSDKAKRNKILLLRRPI